MEQLRAASVRLGGDRPWGMSPRASQWPRALSEPRLTVSPKVHFCWNVTSCLSIFFFLLSGQPPFILQNVYSYVISQGTLS